MGDKLLNYRTTIAARRTVGEIQDILAQHGARSISLDYGETTRQPIAVSFVLPTAHGLQAFRLPANIEGVQATLIKQLGAEQKALTNIARACDVGWRIVKDWVEAQMAIIEAGMVAPDEVFLPYMLNGAGVSVYETYQASPTTLLNP